MKVRRSLFVLAALLLVLIIPAFAACEPVDVNTPVVPGEDGLVSITVYKQPSKTSYYIGETFDPSGMVLKANYEDGSAVNLLYEDCTYNTEPLGAEDTAIVITYGSQSVSVPITVTEVPEIKDDDDFAYVKGIRLVRDPDKTEYTVGEIFDPTGIVVNAVYSDSTEVAIPSSQLKYSDDPLSVDDTQVTLSYEKFTVTVSITVSKYSVSIKTDENIVHRMEAEAADLSTIKLVGWAAEKDIVEKNYLASGGAYLANLSSAEGYVEYGVYSSVEGKVTLYITCALGSEGGTLYMDNAFTATWNGSPFITGATLVGTAWTDFQTIRLGCVPLKKGDNTLRLTRKGTCPNFDCVDFDVNNPDDEVATVLEKIELIKAPDKTDYIAGETFDPTGMIVRATYSDKSTADIDLSELNYSTAALTADDTEISVSYNGLEVKVNISVTAPTLTKIEVTTLPRTQYVIGEVFNPYGMVVIATYEGGATRTIPVSELEYSTEPLTADDTQITVSYGGKSVIVNISVSKYSIRIETDEHKSYKLEAEAADLSTVTPAQWVIEANKSLIENGASSSGGKHLSCLSGAKGYVDYGVYSEVDTTVMLYIYCSNGSAAALNVDTIFNVVWNGMALTTGATIQPGTWSNFQKIPVMCVQLKKGDNVLRLNLNGAGNCPNFDCVEFDVNDPDDTYEPNVTKLELITPPSNTDYYVGESFDPTDMVVRATFDNGSHKDIDIADLEYSSAALTASDTQIAVSYGGFTVSVTITVSVPTVEKIELITPPDRTSYVKGELFNPEGMVVKATYENSSVANIPVSELTYPTEPLTEDVTEVTVSFGGCTVKVTISVSKYSLKIESNENKTYRLEAENADLSTFTVNSNYSIVENNANASGGKQLCNLWAVSGYVDYGVYSEIDGKVSIYIYVATGVDNVKADSAFSMTWNGNEFITGADVPNKGWTTIQKIYLGCVTLTKGENVLRLTKKGTCPNFDCVDFEVNAPSAVLDSEVDVKLPDDVSQRSVEAESLSITGTPANGAGKFVKDGGTAIENLGTAGNTVTIEIYSQSAKTVNLAIVACQAYGTPLDFATVFTVTLNGAEISVNASIPSNASWSTYAETSLGTLDLAAGKNTLVFAVKRTGQAPNIDKFNFTVADQENA